MKTIAIPSVQSTDVKSAYSTKSVSFNQSALFILSAVAVQLINNSVAAFTKDLMSKLNDTETPDYKKPQNVLIGEFLLTQKFNQPVTPEMLTENAKFFEGELTRTEVITLRKFITLAMDQQDMLRDEDNTARKFPNDYPDYTEKFDADQYIQLRHLLLDVREWLCGSVED